MKLEHLQFDSLKNFLTLLRTMPFYINVYQVLMGINKDKSPIINVSKAPCLLELDCPKRCKLSQNILSTSELPAVYSKR